VKRDIEKGVLLEHINLKRFTSWNIGGAADYFYWPKDLHGLMQFLKRDLPKPITFLGLGSNTLVSDLGVAGTVIITQGVLKEMALLDEYTVRAEAGLSCAQVARFAAKHNLVDGEFLAGIPGTVGGALYMNAGAFGGETWEYVQAVETINLHGEIKMRGKAEFVTGYRFCKGLAVDEWFVAGHFKFPQGDGKAGLEKIKNLLECRSDTQPTGEPSCGSVFRNPKPEFAARLIQDAGLKGFSIGGAQISEKHANFIINLGDTKATDVLALVAHIQKVVKEKFNIDLIPEMKFIGRP
jgi:UDP-N-acetylmuramate dehydrogenase